MKETTETSHQTTFIMAAKSFVGMVRDNNEDNFQASSNLDRVPMAWTNNELCELSPRGALLVVADGMGGMNAGEVASEIAIETVKDCFTPEKITEEVIKTRYTAERFMNAVITESDNRIKQTAAENPTTKGMGTTMVMGWVLGNSLYVSWAGDSRAYVFNPSKGLKRLTKDHSLVQELVDSGKISKEDAFDYPDSNVITNCLSAVSQKAVPESLTMPHQLEEGDIIMLCSDGLCGLIRDTEIQSVIANNQDDMTACCDALIKAACDAGGHDNVTVALCKIVSSNAIAETPEDTSLFNWKLYSGIAIFAILLGIGIFYMMKNNDISTTDPTNTDSIASSYNNDTINVTTGKDTITLKKTYKYIRGIDSTDNVSAELKVLNNTNWLYIKADFGNKKTDYWINNFTETVVDDSLTGRFVCEFKKEGRSINYTIHFNKDYFDKDQLDGYFTIDGENDTIFLKNVPLVKPSKSRDREVRDKAIDSTKGEKQFDKFRDLFTSDTNQLDSGLTRFNPNDTTRMEADE